MRVDTLWEGVMVGQCMKMDIEDLVEADGKAASDSSRPRDMLTPLLRTSLTKQGYKLIGTHSGVKMCRC